MLTFFTSVQSPLFDKVHLFWWRTHSDTPTTHVQQSYLQHLTNHEVASGMLLIHIPDVLMFLDVFPRHWTILMGQQLFRFIRAMLKLRRQQNVTSYIQPRRILPGSVRSVVFRLRETREARDLQNVKSADC